MNEENELFVLIRRELTGVKRYMTEEETDDEGETIIRHPLQWCSNGIFGEISLLIIYYFTNTALQSLKALLDSRIKTANSAKGKFILKPRITGEPSLSVPIPGAPSWAIKRGYQTTPTSSRTIRVRIHY